MTFCRSLQSLQSVAGQYVCLSMCNACIAFLQHLQIAEIAVTVDCVTSAQSHLPWFILCNAAVFT